MRKTLPLLLLLALGSSPISAVITFTQLDDDIFTVSHRIKGFGSRGRAMKLVYEKAASLCVAAGYTHYSVLEQESQAGQQYQAANASVRIQLHPSDGDGRVDCAEGANPEYVEQAREKLAKRGYVAPEPVGGGTGSEAEGGNKDEDEDEGDGTTSESCSLEQIAAMARAGLSNEQIRAACP